MAKKLVLNEILIFEWDSGNIEKNREKHNIEPDECEKVFYDEPVFFYDEKHSQAEDRYVGYGITNNNRNLAVIFTLRSKKIRVISVRDQNRKERKVYYEST